MSRRLQRLVGAEGIEMKAKGSFPNEREFLLYLGARWAGIDKLNELLDAGPVTITLGPAGTRTAECVYVSQGGKMLACGHAHGGAAAAFVALGQLQSESYPDSTAHPLAPADAEHVAMRSPGYGRRPPDRPDVSHLGRPRG